MPKLRSKANAFRNLLPMLIVATGVILLDQAQAQQSFPITCRGGGQLSISNDGAEGVRIRFQPAAGSAPQGMSPGQCTWSDRALRPGEPTVICDSGSNAAQYIGLLDQSTNFPILQVFNDGQGCMRVTRVGP